MDILTMRFSEFDGCLNIYIEEEYMDYNWIEGKRSKNPADDLRGLLGRRILWINRAETKNVTPINSYKSLQSSVYVNHGYMSTLSSRYINIAHTPGIVTSVLNFNLSNGYYRGYFRLELKD